MKTGALSWRRAGWLPPRAWTLLLSAALAFGCTAAPSTAQGPDATPAWLADLFPNTGAPHRVAPRLRRLDAREIDVRGRTGAAVTVELIHPDLAGRDRTARARIYLPPGLLLNPSRRAPLIHAAGYELNEAGALGLLAQGYAVSTPHAHPLNPLGRGVNLDRAILHAARALPCIDPLRVSIQGGSAGGWMTLMLAADAFPIVWARPDVPPIHWGYNAAYIGEQQEAAAPAPGATEPRLPVLRAVGPIAEQSRRLLGVPFDNPAFLAASPLAHLDTITAPVLVTFSTADVLVPIDQVDEKLVRPRDRSRFPQGFWTEVSSRFPGFRGCRTLLTALPSERRGLFVATPPGDREALPRAGAPQARPVPLVLPFSKEKGWSIVVIDEGPMEPALGHFKYAWTLDSDAFRRWAEEQGVRAGQLTSVKLERLMKRMRGEPWRPFRLRSAESEREQEGRPLDYPEAERADVLLGLAAFASDDARAVHLARLYGKLPERLKALGPRLGDGSAAGVRTALATLLRDPGSHSFPRSVSPVHNSSQAP